MEDIKTENLTIKIEKKPGCLVELNIEASPALIQQAHKRAIKNVKKEIHIDGFRKGKAPDDFIIKNYPENIEQNLRSSIGDIAFVESQKEFYTKHISLIPLNSDVKINYDLKSHSLEKGATIFFSYETEPTPPSIDPKKFKLKEPKKRSIGEKEVKETMRQAQFFYATWKEVDRPIQNGDYVIIDLDSIDKEPPQRVFSDTRFEIKDKSIATWMKLLLLGARQDEVIEGISKADEDASEKEKKEFQEKKVRITIKKIEEASLPKLDDEFAKKMGSKDIKEAEKSIKKMLEKTEEDKTFDLIKEQINAFLIKTYQFDLPASILSSEIQYRKNQMLSNPEFKKSFDAMDEKAQTDYIKKIEKEAKEAILIFYLTRTIAKDAKIKIEKDEIKKEAILMIIDQTPPGQEPNLKNIPKELEALCLSKLYLKKVQEFILNSTKRK